MRRSRSPWAFLQVGVIATLYLFIVGVLVVGFSSCQTYEAVTAAPVEFWTTAEEIIGALLLDVWSVIELFL